ncbi:MAG: hypothetical protein EXR51_03340 [Dehalococcoidia bacterium]|nr:hypothetical protein [Dehalococcoidia bacterium]
MELRTRDVGETLRMVFEIVKRAPVNCPSRAVALGASALFVVASAVMARLAITGFDQASRVEEHHLCEQCGIRRQCSQSRARD